MSGDNTAYKQPQRHYRAHLGNRVIVSEGEGEYTVLFATQAMRDAWLKTVRGGQRLGPHYREFALQS